VFFISLKEVNILKDFLMDGGFLVLAPIVFIVTVTVYALLASVATKTKLLLIGKVVADAYLLACLKLLFPLMVAIRAWDYEKMTKVMDDIWENIAQSFRKKNPCG
jgi:hypothetical protein